MKAKAASPPSPPLLPQSVRGIFEPMKDGSLFVRLKRGDGTEFVLPLLTGRLRKKLLPGTTVEVRLKEQGGRSVAILKRVLPQEELRYTGVLKRKEGKILLEPDDLSPPILLRSSPSLEGHLGKRVRVGVRHPRRSPPYAAEVLEVLSPLSPLEQATEQVLREFSLPRTFPPEILRQAERLSPLPFKGRVDLQELPFVTIDGKDARDFDDAVCALKTPEGYELYVAIADVAAYVPEGDPLDQEAYERATSIYLIERVIPMLPERLSNELCSLVPQEPRPVQGVQMRLNRHGIVEKVSLFQGMILSRARLNYTAVSDFLEEGEAEAVKGLPREVKQSLKVMGELTAILLEQREARGGLDFDLPESEFVIGLKGEVSEILYPRRRLAHKLIEEFMILANVEVARVLTQAGFPLIYRCHARPPRERYENLRRFAEERLGLKLPSLPTPGVYQMLLAQEQDPSRQRLLHTMVLRSMAQAQYTLENLGHFGLNLPFYCHFTSPIRRYPDLVNHRLFKQLLKRGGMSRRRAEELRERLKEVAQHCTEQEIRAVEVERRLARLVKAQFMENKVGERFRGVITGVAPFGIFVELEGYLVDGLVPLEDLPRDHYRVLRDGVTLEGERRGITFAIGDEVEVELRHVDLRKGHLDFHLLSHRPLR